MSVHDSLPLFVSGSSDGVVKLWDITKIEADFSLISRSTYELPNDSILSVCFLDLFSCLSTKKGYIQLLDLESGKRIRNYCFSDMGIQQSPEKLEDISSVTVLRPITINKTKHLVCGNQNGMLAVVDSRVNKDVMFWKNPVENGPVSSIYCDENWIMTASKRGKINIYDTKYNLNVKEWTLPIGIRKMDVILQPSMVDTGNSLLQQKTLDTTAKSSKPPFLYVCGDLGWVCRYKIGKDTEMEKRPLSLEKTLRTFSATVPVNDQVKLLSSIGKSSNKQTKDEFGNVNRWLLWCRNCLDMYCRSIYSIG